MKQDLGITLLKESYKNCKPGFRVRLGYKNGSPQIQRSFLFSNHGTIADTYYAAQEFRNKELSKLKKANYQPYKRVLIKPSKNNKTGIIGVHRAQSYSHGKKTGIFSWKAFWNINGKVHSAQFSENKYGVQEAKRRAVACREARKHLYL